MNNNKQNSLSEQYKGVVVPMVTPFTPQGDFDETSVRKIIDYMIECGVDGIFVPNSCFCALFLVFLQHETDG